MRHTKKLKTSLTVLVTALCLTVGSLTIFQLSAFAAAAPIVASSSSAALKTGDTQGAYQCGAGANAVSTSIDIGCKKEGNPIVDAAFAIIRLLSDGVGLVIVGSIIYAGIQYSSSGGDPQSTAKAIHRIRESLVALLIFIFGYAILNYVIPAGFLQ
jgi:hypothetical protein